MTASPRWLRSHRLTGGGARCCQSTTVNKSLTESDDWSAVWPWTGPVTAADQINICFVYCKSGHETMKLRLLVLSDRRPYFLWSPHYQLYTHFSNISTDSYITSCGMETQNPSSSSNFLILLSLHSPWLWLRSMKLFIICWIREEKHRHNVLIGGNTHTHTHTTRRVVCETLDLKINTSLPPQHQFFCRFRYRLTQCLVAFIPKQD